MKQSIKDAFSGIVLNSNENDGNIDPKNFSSDNMLWVADIHLENRTIGDALFTTGELADTLEQVVKLLRTRKMGNRAGSIYESPNKTRVTLIGTVLDLD